ncbi:MAG: aminotransferase class V-fold PLP-dependent enzyme [Gemmataceae bacterium]
MTAVREYETRLVRKLLAGLRDRPAWRVWGLRRDEDLPRRTPTLGLTHSTLPAQRVVEHLAAQEIYAWAGNFYAVELAEALGVEAGGGFVRLGLVHYNTEDEVERTLAALDELR